MYSARGPSRTPTPIDGARAHSRALTPRDNERAPTPRDGARSATPRPEAATQGPLPAWGTPREAAPRPVTVPVVGAAAARDSLKAAAGASLGLPPTAPGTEARGLYNKSIIPHPGRAQGFRLGTVVAPDVPPAGDVFGAAENFGRGRRNEVIYDTPRTPELDQIRRRHRKRAEPGEVYVNWAMKDVPPPDAGDGYGGHGCKGETVAENFMAGHKTGIALYLNTVGERVYKSTKEEPLGTAALRGHRLPKYLDDENWPGFGRATESDLNTAKEAIFPRGIKEESSEIKAMYRKTHGNFEPGETVHRKYNWPKTVADDPMFCFGLSDKNDRRGQGRGARRLLHPDCAAPGALHRTDIVDLRSENYQQVREDPLAKSRNLKQSTAWKDPEHVHGLKTRTDMTSAGGLIRGLYTDHEQLPDKDLGRCITFGRRNFVTAEPMGVPSIRLDKVAPPLTHRSVASCVNYGDDVDASGLIAPNKHLMMGVSDLDLQVPRGKEELRSLFRAAKSQLNNDTFDMLFNQAADTYGDDEGKVSVELLTFVYDDFIAARGRLT
eukprot:TRINITY_DN90644_c0_g1_i1.p1 TRINITY_DN90644_c0_g1~~TRINITY_DN90644_c0_g1_i1.p1  ORF type:complete len:550 (+),score=105.87 TRINITY_DN90644_c0_g1_i1:86-1735(+)